MDELARIAQTKLVVSPIPMTASNVMRIKRVPSHAGIREREDEVMVRPKQLNGHLDTPVFMSLTVSCLVNDDVLEPPVVRRAMVSRVEVPIGRSERKGAWRKPAPFGLKVIPVTPKGCDDIHITFAAKDEGHYAVALEESPGVRLTLRSAARLHPSEASSAASHCSTAFQLLTGSLHAQAECELGLGSRSS